MNKKRTQTRKRAQPAKRPKSSKLTAANLPQLLQRANDVPHTLTPPEVSQLHQGVGNGRVNRVINAQYLHIQTYPKSTTNLFRNVDQRPNGKVCPPVGKFSALEDDFIEFGKPSTINLEAVKENIRSKLRYKKEDPTATSLYSWLLKFISKYINEIYGLDSHRTVWLRKAVGYYLGSTDPNVKKITDQDIQYEFIAHYIGYNNQIPSKANMLLNKWGYKSNWHDYINDRETGLFAGLLMPEPEKKSTLLPILVFRGSETSNEKNNKGYIQDWLLTDGNVGGIGRNQFIRNKNKIGKIIKEAGKKINLTGHSLGGALAQYTAMEFSDSISQMFLFQSPGVDDIISTVKFNKENKEKSLKEKIKIRHHVAKGDIVDPAGFGRLDGEYFEYSLGGLFIPHTYHLMNTPEFRDRRKRIFSIEMGGRPVNALENLPDPAYPSKSYSFKERETSDAIQHTKKYPHKIKQGFLSVLRNRVSILLTIIGKMLNEAFEDDWVRQEIFSKNLDQLSKLKDAEKAQMLKILLEEIITYDDIRAILKLLKSSNKDTKNAQRLKALLDNRPVNRSDSTNWAVKKELIKAQILKTFGKP